MPTKSEENKQVIQHRYDALGRGDTDTLLALICLALVPIIFLFKKAKVPAPASMAAH